MKLSLLVLVEGVAVDSCFGASLKRTSSDELLLTEWQEFKTTHGKVYAEATEDDRRFQLYLATRYAVARHNHEQALGLHSYLQAINKLADIETSEFLGTSTQINFDEDRIGRESSKYSKEFSSNYLAPASIDWRQNGDVTPVKDQGTQCNAGYAFATIAGLESAFSILKNKKNLSLSEQQIIDCSVKNKGCKIGDINLAADYLYQIGGSQSEETYPYAQELGTCNYNESKIAVPVTCYGYGLRSSEADLQLEILARPVQVRINVPDSLKQYSHGVFSNSECSKVQNYQFVLVVGYETDDKEGNYWIVKNSWGENWGESGYARIARNKGNMCGIAASRVYFCDDKL